MNGGGPRTESKFADILEHVSKMFINILHHSTDTNFLVLGHQERLESNLRNLDKLKPLLDRFTLLKDILTTIYEYRLKPTKEFISFLQDKNPVIDIESRVFKSVNSKLQPYADMLNDIIYIYNNFRNKDKYEDRRQKIRQKIDLIPYEILSQSQTTIIQKLNNIYYYFGQDNIETKIQAFGISISGGKKTKSIKKRLKKKISIKKRSKKKRH